MVIKDLNRPIKSVIKKIQDWIDDGKVDYRNESTSESRYVFEIMDNSITMPMLRKRLNKALMSHITFTRLLVDKDKAVYSTLEYQTKKSLDYLNKVLDHKFKRELNELNKQEKVLLVIDYIKNNLANKLHKMNKDDLRKELQKQNFDDESINKAIVKPITYLTSEHNDELKIIKQQQKNIKNINRTDYLVNLYEEFKKVVKPIYDSKSHSIRRSKLLKNPKIKLMDKNTIRISNRGMNYKDSILIVKKDGYVIPESIYTKVKTFIHKDYDITGIVTDEYPYVVLISNTDGIICIEYNSINYAKEVVNLGKGEYITDVIPATINRRKNIKFIYNKKEYNANHFVKKRKSKLTYNWR